MGLGLSKLIKVNNLTLRLYTNFILIKWNYIGDIGMKYLGLGLYELIKLVYLDLNLR